MANEEKLKFEISAIDSATRVFNQVGAAAKNLQGVYTGMVAAFGGVASGLAIEKIVDATLEWERANNRLTATLRATGGAVGITRRELDDMALSMSKTMEFSERQFTNAEAALISFGGMHEDIFKGALKDTADLAAKMGIDLVSAAHLVGRAYQDPILGLRGFQKELGTLTFVEKEYIAQLEAAGKTEEAQLAIHDLIQRKIGGTAELMNTGLTKAVKDNQKAWEELETGLGNFGKGAIVGSANALTNWVQAVKDMAAAARSGRLSLDPSVNRANIGRPGGSGASGSWGESEAEAAAKAASAAAKIVEEQNRLAEAHQKAIPILAHWNKLLGDQTNEQRALAIVLEGEAKLWTDLDKAKLLNIAVELDYRRIYKERSELAAAYAKALHDETQGEEENLATRVRVVENAFTKGTRETFRDYIDHAKNAAEQANFLFTNAFKNMEDGLVEFVRTGKLDFRSFADSVISDLIRIQIRQAMAGMLNTGTGLSIGASIGAFLGFGGSTAVDTSAFAGHTGGVVGQDIMQRSLPMSPVGIPRYHSGLAPDERLGIFQTGERIIPRGGSMSGLVQHIHVGGEVTRADVAAAARAGRDLAVAFIAEVRRREPNGPFGG